MSARLRVTILALFAALLGVACAGQQEEVRAAEEEPSDQVQIGCGVNAFKRVDLIFPGSGHLHQFAGTTENLTQDTTVSQLLTRATTCGFSAHKSLYWQPMPVEGDLEVRPIKMTSYTQDLNANTITRPPNGLGLLASRATGEGAVNFRCGNAPDQPEMPYGCTAETWRIVYKFPNCWDGSGLQPSDTTYTGRERCPSGFKAIPHFRTSWHMPNTDGKLTAPVGVAIHEDGLGDIEQYAHADIKIAMNDTDWQRAKACNAGDHSQPCKFNQGGPVG